MPDAALVPLAASRPADWWRLALAAAGGSVFGGTASYLAGRWRGSGPPWSRLPMVRPAMLNAAGAWLADEGPSGLRHQPLSGVPFKVFAVIAGARGLPLLPFVGWALAVRGTRFGLVCLVSALLGRPLRPLLRRHPRPMLLIWSAAFALGLRRSVRSWEQRERGDHPACS
jgi:membrane protein YqaA with SNARE-associated domain